MPERPYLSIGEVLALLLEEFPDVTISKIRFLESQGLIDPERTPSGYRKFYDPDVERLRVILREQKENFLPLRVIRDRLESGEIDETGMTPPRGLRNVTLIDNVTVLDHVTLVQNNGDGVHDHLHDGVLHDHVHDAALHETALHDGARNGTDDDAHDGVTVGAGSFGTVRQFERRHEPAYVATTWTDGGFDETGELIVPPGTPVPTGHHPAAQLRPVMAPPPPADVLPPSAPPAPARAENPAAAFFASTGADTAPSLDTVRDTYVASELCTIVGITIKQLTELESYGLLAGRGSGTNALYSTSDLAIARAAAGFLARGVEPRHLRAWRQSAEREAALFEQLVLPLIRQRNPQSRQQAAALLLELSQQGAELRAAILTSALQHHLEA